VTILTYDAKREPLGQGSGFIVAKNQIATNYHVVAGSASASIIFNDGSVSSVTSVVAGSAPKDVVIIEAETGGRLPLPLGDELELKVGETVYAIGAPKGLIASLSNGLVSAFREEEGQFLIQITAPIAPGSSGGPVFNSQGRVVGISTSRLKDGSFGFAVGVGDIQHVLKAPLSVKIKLSDLAGEEESSPSSAGLNVVQGLFDQKKYEDARVSFEALPDPTKSTFEGELLLCQIEEERKEYRPAIKACNAAIQDQPNNAAPYGAKAFSMLMLGDGEEAETAAAKAAQLSDASEYRNLLGLVHYSIEKYELIPKDFPANSNDTFVLTLLAGAALHNHDYGSYRTFRDKVTTIKGPNNGWALFTEAADAEKNLDWDLAAKKFRQCDEDNEFIDSACIVGLAAVELTQTKYDAAKADIDSAVAHYPKNAAVLSEGIFIDMLVGDTGGADRLHDLLKANSSTVNEFTECLYFYGRNRPLLATNHCQAAIHGNENDYRAWSNAGYAALDNADFKSAMSYFGRALRLFNDSKEKHTVTQVLDVCWGTLTAEYYAGDRKNAKSLYRGIKKDYPQFVTINALKELPLVWSDSTSRLIDRITADWK
jgi:tetratricopeptide (TPR) repeat protein